ncbi:hypothetical protein FD754_023821 [Muntiacus muntjak]|uniref:CCHC-type domain-containing protein n=1 Tax=Muntiacus muntjak TaxID=9888 RepID=A0A5N3US34_MUNMU|nr:hypothetical protein FD754_023820 [Muntiacus muntjak]KAB0339573.1 hypothetical protein FD754_023821 [Muntiacus muntjak]
MGSTASKPDPQYSTPLECLLANLRTLRLKGYIRPKQLTFLCSQAWPQYSLDNGSQWPAAGTLDFDVLRDLDNYCRRTGKWSECSQEGHWAKMFPNPRPPSKPCPLCKQRGHWASDCPQASRAPTSRGRRPERPRETSCPPPALELLSFDDD